MANEDYGVTLTADATQYQQSMQQSAAQTNALTDALARCGQQVQSLWQRANRKLTFIAAGEVAAITAMTVSAANLDQQMSQLNARMIMVNKTAGDYDRTITGLRTKFGQTSQEVIGLVTQLNQLQVPFSQQAKTVESYNKLSAVTGENVNALASSQQNFMRSMGANQKSVDNYSSMMAGLQANTGAAATATADFATSIAPLSRTVGMSSQQIAGISATFVKSGQDGYRAANVYTKMLNDINTAVQYGSPDLAKYSSLIGVSVDQFKGMDKATAVTKIFEEINRQGPRASKILEQFGIEGVPGQRAIQATMQQGGFSKAIKEAEQGYGNTQKFNDAAKEALGGLNDEFKKLTQSITVVGQGIGAIFVPAIQKAISVVNFFLSPISKLVMALNQLPDGLKTLLAVGAGLGVAANFLPKIAGLLSASSLIPQVLKGPASLGFRAGWNPGKLNEAQRNFAAGEGAVGPKTLYSAGQFAGRNLNPRTWIGRWGGDEAVARAEMMRNNLNVPGAAGRLGAQAARFGGNMVSSFMLPWQPGYMSDPSQMHKNPSIRNMMISGESTWREALGMKPRLQASKVNYAGVAEASDRLGADAKTAIIKSDLSSSKLLTKQINDQIKAQTELVKNTKQLGTASQEVRRSFMTITKAVATGSLGAASLAGQGAGKLAGMAYRGLGGIKGIASSIGPVGLAMGAIAGGTAIHEAYRSGIEGGKVEEGQDTGAGSNYRQALGIASRATTTFAEVVERNSKSMESAATTVRDAVRVTKEDVDKTRGKAVADKNITNLTGTDLQNYVTNTLFGASPKEAQALKYDLVAKLGAKQAQSMLDTGTNRTTNLTGMYGAINEGNQGFWGQNVVSQQFGLSKKNQEATQMATGTARQNMQSINERMGSQAAARYALAQFGDLQEANFGAATSGGGFKREQFDGSVSSGSREAQGRQQAYRGLFNAEDKESIKALEEAEKNVAKRLAEPAQQGTTGSGGMYRGVPIGGTGATSQARELTKEQRQKIYDEEQYKLAHSGTALGDQLKQAMIDAGKNPNAGFQQGDLTANPMGIFGNQKERMRLMSRGGRAAANLFQGGQATDQVMQALNNEGNAGMAMEGTQALVTTTTKMTGSLDGTIAELQKFGATVGETNPPLRAMINAAVDSARSLRNYNNQMAGRTDTASMAKQSIGDFQGALGAYKANPNDPTTVENLEKAKQGAAETALAYKDMIVGIAQQYRALDHQREQGQEELQRSQTRALRDYNLQRQYSEDDFNLQRSRAEDAYNLQRKYAIEDYNTSRERAEKQFNKSRAREEEDHKTQLVRQAEDAAKSIYDVYSRIGTKQTWDAANLLQNMADQSKAMAQQETDLAKVRKMGLSDKVISQMGLNEAGNAQQLNRLIEGFTSDPNLIKQFNKSVKGRQTLAGDLATDPANIAFSRGEKDRKKALKRSKDDFDEGMENQEKDFKKTMARGAKAFNLQMTQQVADYNKMMTRQRKAMTQSFTDMNTDFAHQMDVASENISFFAEQMTMSFDDAYKTVAARTTGETKKQTAAMKTLMTALDVIVKTDIKDMDSDLAKPYTEWGLTPGKKNMTVKEAEKVIFTTPDGKKAAAGGSKYESDAGGQSGASGAGDNQHGWPTHSHSTKGGASYGQRGLWMGSKSLGPGHHSGTDFPNPTGTPIYAAEDGEVVYKGWGGAYGNLTKIAHGNGVQTWYAHQNSQAVKTGDTVRQGEKIGEVGGTGNVTGPHLHFEVRVSGYDKDPLKWLGGNSIDSSGGGGGGGQSAAQKLASIMPDFDKITKKFEGRAEDLKYFEKTRSPFRSRTQWEKGALAKAMKADFSKKWMDKHGSQYTTGSDSSGLAPGGVDTGGKMGARGVWNALRTGGLSEAQAAGVMGNMWAESNMQWNIVQGGGHSPSTNHSNGYGLVQWTPGTKLGEILKKAGKKNNLENQVWALLQQLAGRGPHAESSAGTDLKKQKTVFDATRSFLRKYERAADTSDEAVNRRNRNSEGYYKQFHGDKLPGGNPGGAKGERLQKALNYANKHEGHPYEFGGMWDCSGFMSQLQNIITMGTTGGRRYSTPDFHGNSAEGFTRNANSSFMVGVNPSPGKHGHMAGNLLGHTVESSGSYGVRVDSGSKGKDQSIFSWFGGLRGYAAGTPKATSGWSWVGEHGPELRNFRGGETVLSAAQSMNAVMKAKSGQVVTGSGHSSSTTNNAYDHSVKVASVTVKADNPRAMIAELEREARVAALTGVK